MINISKTSTLKDELLRNAYLHSFFLYRNCFRVEILSINRIYSFPYLIFDLPMLSLYIHIPFCASKCAYCSFNSIPTNSSDILIDEYIQALKQEIDYYAATLKDKTLKTLYFWWGTPSRIWVGRIIDIIEYITTKFDLEELAELSIELNPYPETEVLDFVRTLNKRYPKISRLRYSFGIQSLDDEVLKLTWRAYSFGGIVEFLRSLVKLKQDNNVFNFDFIAFGKFLVSKNWHKQLWHEHKREFLKNFLNSWYVDSISLYTLEGLREEGTRDEESGNRNQGSGNRDEGSGNRNQGTGMRDLGSGNRDLGWGMYHGDDDEIMEEFLVLKEIIEQAWFGRYEISNFARAGKASIHNMVYRNMEPYIGLWLSAASFIGNTRRTNTWDMKHYLEWHRIDEKEVHTLDDSDLLIEEFFLRLRTREWIANILKFNSVLVPHYQWLLTNYQWAWLLSFDWAQLRLTDEGMNVYNTIITDLLEKI